MIYKRPIKIEKLNIDTEEWVTYIPLLHANVNKPRKDREYHEAGSVRSTRQLNFDMRYNPLIKEIGRQIELYRIVYDGQSYNIVDYDDYMERHQNIRLLGVST